MGRAFRDRAEDAVKVVVRSKDMNICYNRGQEKIDVIGKIWKFGSIVARLRSSSAACNCIVLIGSFENLVN